MIASFVPREGRNHRISRNKTLRSGEWLIVCGALETEVNYIRGLIEKVNEFCPKDKKIRYQLCSISLDPKGLVEKIRRQIIICSKKLDFRFSKIFVVFDKDEFSDDDYNQAIEMCNNNGYHAIYSNECIELWFYLHFSYTESKINRTDLINKLDNIFKKNNLVEGYSKNDKEIFEKLFKYGSIKNAMIRAEKLNEIACQKTNSKAKQKPITTMNILLDEIEQRQQELGLKSIYEILKK